MIPSYKAGRRLGGANRRNRRDRSEFRELVSRRLAREGFGESTPVTLADCGLRRRPGTEAILAEAAIRATT